MKLHDVIRSVQFSLKLNINLQQAAILNPLEPVNKSNCVFLP